MSFIKEIAILLPIIAIIAILTSQLVAVPTESMSPSINAGDVVLIEKTNVLDVFGELNPDDVKVGDIIVYSKPLESQQGENQSESNESIIHRVVDVRTSQGQKYLILKGDNNPVPDSERVYPSQITGRALTWDKNPIVIPELGHVVIFLKTLLHGGG